MIQGGDHDDVDADGVEIIISNFHCPNCESRCEFAWLVSWDDADDADATEPSPGASEAKTAVLTYGAVQQELARVRKQAEELASAKGRSGARGDRAPRAAATCRENPAKAGDAAAAGESTAASALGAEHNRRIFRG